jgi:hypothetical protein
MGVNVSKTAETMISTLQQAQLLQLWQLNKTELALAAWQFQKKASLETDCLKLTRKAFARHASCKPAEEPCHNQNPSGNCNTGTMCQRCKPL